MSEEEKAQEELEEMLYEIRMLEDTGKEMELQKSQLMIQYQDVDRALVALEAIKEGEEVLLPIGGNVLVKAEIKDKEKVLMNVGANVVVEKSVDESIEATKKLKEEIKEIIKNINAQIEAIKKRLEDINEFFESVGEK